MLVHTLAEYRQGRVPLILPQKQERSHKLERSIAKSSREQMATDTPKGVHEAGLDRARLRCFLSSPWLKRGITRKDGVMYSSPKQPKPKIPDTLKAEVTTRANELIDTILKPKNIQPPPENPRFNYIVDIYGKWYHSAFYFCTKYCCPGHNAISPSFE